MLGIIPYGVLLGIHIGAFLWSVSGIIVADSQGLRWLLGFKQTLSARFLSFWHRFVWVGISTSIVTGFMLFWPMREFLLEDPAFLVKVSLVVMLVINAWFIGSHMTIATTQPFAEVPRRQKVFLLISGAVSVCGWVGVYICAQFLPI